MKNAVALGFGVAMLATTALGVPLAIGWTLLSNDRDGLAFGQPAVERRAQNRLPKSSDPIWAVLARTRIDADTERGIFKPHFPSEAVSLKGRTISVSGFLLPLESRTETDHFLLSKNTPVCPFCPPGSPNEMIEVKSTAQTYSGGGLVTVTGRFELQDDEAAGLFYRIDRADVQG